MIVESGLADAAAQVLVGGRVVWVPEVDMAAEVADPVVVVVDPEADTSVGVLEVDMAVGIPGAGKEE